ncbi:heavy-metal-associated domain-containing protein [Janthinobacterium psychrotolerans]|uniref:Copper chaperone/Cu+-exporting ATPase n=1 Tax=Janthinobacterium psychrotolerans TaxID=1747903 RepID=A0A1A7C2P6_9BURK|nr:heavy-metal-associated domain-containing protein [Janthinobacterium psychrotolerans]OBV38588.1 copper chaperone/Cu+-exporting ATPase [Janthinobacterium psychrotolerans]
MQTARLSITGMDHEGCADVLTEVLERVRGVATVCVSLARNDATVQFDETVAPRERLLDAVIDAVNRAGFIGELELAQAPAASSATRHTMAPHLAQ